MPTAIPEADPTPTEPSTTSLVGKLREQRRSRAVSGGWGRSTTSLVGKLRERRRSRAVSGGFGKLRERAGLPVPADSVAVFRIGYGFLVAYGSIRFLTKGWVDTLYLDPQNHLTYRGFDWVQPLPGPFMHLHIAALAVLGVCIAAGYRHRLATALFLIGFAYTEMIEAALYLNHYWFITLTGVLLLLLPVHHHWSIDAATGRVSPHPQVAAGVVYALRAQLAVVYCFAGLAKLNPDWLFRAQPMRLWLADRTHLPMIGPLLDEPLLAHLAAVGGAAFDCTIVAWLLWRRTRPYAYTVLVVFHLVTGALFQIGIFPWVMIVSALIFFDPAWPRRFIPGNPSTRRDRGVTKPVTKPPVIAVLAVLALVQLALPLRHYAMDGNVRWTEEGYYFAWRVMLTEKAGHVDYRVTDPATGDTRTVDPQIVLTDWQANHAATRPDLIHATAHLIAKHHHRRGIPDVEVRADAWVSINGRPARRLIDPTIDLAAHRRGHPPPGWILDQP